MDGNRVYLGRVFGSWVLVRLRHDHEGCKGTNWLVIKRHDGFEREGVGESVLDQDRSVASGHVMDEIAAGKGRSPKPFMLGKAKSFKADAIWHSERDKDTRKPATIAPAPKSKPARARKSGLPQSRDQRKRRCASRT